MYEQNSMNEQFITSQVVTFGVPSFLPVTPTLIHSSIIADQEAVETSRSELIDASWEKSNVFYTEQQLFLSVSSLSKIWITPQHELHSKLEFEGSTWTAELALSSPVSNVAPAVVPDVAVLNVPQLCAARRQRVASVSGCVVDKQVGELCRVDG